MKALLLGYYGACNLGDDMMLYCLLQWLMKQKIQVTVVSENPFDTKYRFKVKTVGNVPLLGEWGWPKIWFRKETIQLLNAIRQHDILIVGGGNLVRDDLGLRTFWYTMEKVVLAFLLHKPVYFINVGFKHPSTKQGYQVLKWALKRCCKIIVRDQLSVEVCNELGCKHLVKWVPDIVLRFPKLWENVIFDKQQAWLRSNSYCIVCLRGNPNVFGQYSIESKQVKNLAAILDYLIKKYELKIVFFPFQKGIDENNKSFHQQIFRFMKYKNNVVVKKWTENFLEVINYIQSAKLVIAMRLHAAVLAVALNRPCIAMPYDSKVYEFSKQAGIKYLLFPSDTYSFNKTLTCFEQALNEVPDYTQILKSVQIWERMSLW